MKKLNILFLLLFLNISCSGSMLTSNYRPPDMGVTPLTGFSFYSNSAVKRDFKAKSFEEKDSFNDKSGYVILGILALAVTAASIAIPIIIMNN